MDGAEKLVVVEFRKVDPLGRPTLDQFFKSNWICDARSAIGYQGMSPTLERAVGSCGALLAQDESELGASWSTALPGEIWEVLESLGMFSELSGIAVFEVVLHGKAGPVLTNRNRRFLVVQRGSANVIYSCDNVNDAFSVANQIASGVGVSVKNVDEMPRLTTRPSQRWSR